MSGLPTESDVPSDGGERDAILSAWELPLLSCELRGRGVICPSGSASVCVLLKRSGTVSDTSLASAVVDAVAMGMLHVGTGSGMGQSGNVLMYVQTAG
jgi:hypothetical protein